MRFWQTGRRLSAGLCALALMAALVAFPVRARAAAAGAVAAAALEAVGFGVTVAAFLSMCGVHAYSDGSLAYDDWESGSLQDLIDRFNVANPDTPINPNSVKGYAFGASVLIAHNAYVALTRFVEWIRETFGLADNQVGVQLGAYAGVPVLPVYSGTPTYANTKDVGLYLHRLQSHSGGAFDLAMVGVAKQADTYVFFAYHDSGLRLFIVSALSGAQYSTKHAYSDSSYDKGVSWTSLNYQYSIFDSQTNKTYIFYIPSGYGWIEPSYINPDIPVYQSRDEGLLALIHDGARVFYGVTADTSGISTPAELPEDAEWAGMRVGGLSAAATAQDIEGAVETAVTERAWPAVRPVEVTVAEGTEIDANTGEVIGAESGTVVISPDVMPLSLSDYAIPGLQNLFPFSVPWDIARVWQALDAEPRWPLEDVTFSWDIPELWGNEPLTVRFRLEDMPQQVSDAVQSLARTVRAFLLIIACIGFLIFAVGFIKF